MSKISYLLFLVTLFLSAIGLFLLYESSSYKALIDIGDRYFFVKNQFIWIILGVVLSLIISRFSYKQLYNFSLPVLLATIILLFLVFTPLGIELKGAKRWLDLGITVLQPSELLKISLTLYLAAWLSNKEKGRLFAFLILLFIPVILVAVEPDLGTSMIVAATSIIVYFLSGAKIREFVLILILMVIACFALIKLEPYRMARLTGFMNFDIESLSDNSYHLKQILIALGSGGLTGVGFGNSIQKYAYLPENTTDSIFAIFSEEAGFIGSVLLIFIFFIQTVLGFLICLKSKDTFAKLLSAGIVSFIAIQTFMNLASQVVLIPLTGVPLPFISYGGSSMIINFISIGILLNIGNNALTKDNKQYYHRRRRIKSKI